MNLFDLGYGIAGVITAPIWMRKTRGGWSERFGHVTPLDYPVSRPRIMIHGVSVGEVSALRSLVPLLTPWADVVVTATTDTGLRRAHQLYEQVPGVAAIVRYPLDFTASVRRFLDAVRPDVVALAELELWPNFVSECVRRSVRTCVVNGRLSARSFGGYSKFRRFIGPSFAAIDAAAVQDETYADRFCRIGTPRDRIIVTGTMKWDNAVSTTSVHRGRAILKSMGLDPALPTLVAGSTGPGEEALIFEAWRASRAKIGSQLVCAPRKPERFDEAARAMPNCVRRSEKTRDDANQRSDTGSGVGLLDSIGELGDVYAAASAVIVGRSFGDLHGSDPAEPVGLGRPTIIGPAVSDFQSMVDTLESCGGLVRATRGSLAGIIERVLTDQDWARRVAEAGRACCERERGASGRHADLIKRLASGGRASVLQARL